MNKLKYALFFFFAVDVSLFIGFQVSPELLLAVLPQFDIESAGGGYPRLIGVLFLALGIARLYGGLYIQEKGAFTVSMWSWAVELILIVSEIFRGQYLLTENLMALVLAPAMLIWSWQYYQRTFNQRGERE